MSDEIFSEQMNPHMLTRKFSSALINYRHGLPSAVLVYLNLSTEIDLSGTKKLEAQVFRCGNDSGMVILE